MSFLSRFSRKKVERRASIATIAEIPEKNNGWKTKVGFDMKSKIMILTIVTTDRGIGDRQSGINGTIFRGNHDKPGHAKLSRRISERLDGRPSIKISDNYEIDEHDFKAYVSGIALIFFTNNID